MRYCLISCTHHKDYRLVENDWSKVKTTLRLTTTNLLEPFGVRKLVCGQLCSTCNALSCLTTGLYYYLTISMSHGTPWLRERVGVRPSSQGYEEGDWVVVYQAVFSVAATQKHAKYKPRGDEERALHFLIQTRVRRVGN